MRRALRLLEPLRVRVIHVHRLQPTVANNRTDRICRAVDRRLQRLAVRARRLTYDVAHYHLRVPRRHATVARPADAHAHPPELAAADLRHHRLEPIVARRAALWPYADA